MEQISDDRLRHVLIGLTTILRNQHKEIDRLNVAILAIRDCLGSDVDVKLDRALRDNLARSAQYGEHADETLAQLDRIIEQLHRQA